MRHTKRKTLSFVFASGLLVNMLLTSSFAQAAKLGKLEVLSGAGEPLFAQIQVDLGSPQERASLRVKLASEEAFKAARLNRSPNLEKLQFSIENGIQPKTALIEITSAQPLSAGLIEALVELTWSGGRVVREYSLNIASEQKKSVDAIQPSPEIHPPVVQANGVMSPPSTSSLPQVVSKEIKNPNLDATLLVKRGDTLSSLALKLVGNGVTLNQAMAALYEANKKSFIKGSIHLIREGAQIQVPNRLSLQVRSANQALLILAQNDDRNVYSAHARHIGLLTVMNQDQAIDSKTTSGSIAPKEKSVVAGSAPVDRLQIAPSTPQLADDDLSTEELLIKKKALSEANERIALLEKNVSDLQRLLDMQKDVSGDAAVSVSEQAGIAMQAQAETKATDHVANSNLVKTPAQILPESAAQSLESQSSVAAQTPLKKAPEKDTYVSWMSWLLAGVGGLLVMAIVWLIARIARARQKNNANHHSGVDHVDQEDSSEFGKVNAFDETVATASAEVISKKSVNLNKQESSDFDLDEVLSPRVQSEIPVKPLVTNDVGAPIQELSHEVKLDFPEDNAAVEPETSIFDDLESLEKGAFSAQAELNDIRKQQLPNSFPSQFSAASEHSDFMSTEQETIELDVNVSSSKVDSAIWQEVATKLDLAGAYVEIGDADGAKELLNEIMNKGDLDQVSKAKTLLANLN